VNADVYPLVLAQCETHARRMLWAKDALHSVDEWLKLREMRNAFAHDYPEDSELQAAILNRAFVAVDKLVEILHHVKGFAARYAHE
jgi:uncharacterized protein with HEPN domain